MRNHTYTLAQQRRKLMQRSRNKRTIAMFDRMAALPPEPPEGFMWDNNQLVPIGIIEARAKVQMLMPAEHDPYESRTAAPLPQE